MKLIVLLVALGVVVAMYATPSFYLRKGVGKSTQADVTEYLGTPLQASDKPDGSAQWTYQSEKIPKVCVEYLHTFMTKAASEDPTQTVSTHKKTLSEGAWR